jgi:hypothetical protein
MTSTQLAAIAYQLGVIDTVITQLGELALDLNDINEGPLSVKLELTLKAFEERAEEHRKTLNQFTDEIPTDPARRGEG